MRSRDSAVRARRTGTGKKQDHTPRDTSVPSTERAEELIRINALLQQEIAERKRAEESLRESEALYRAIGESIDYGVWVCAPDGRNIYASESFLRLVGITQEQCSNFGWGDVLHPDDAERTIAAWKECVRTGGIWDIEHRFRGLDGRWHPILARGVPVRNNRGDVTYWAGINLDISRLKETEEALRKAKEELELRVCERTAELAEKSWKLEAFFRHSLTPFAFLDREFNFIRVNEAYARACGREVEDFRGHNHFEDYPSEELMQSFQQVVASGKPFSVFGRPFSFPDHPEWGMTYWDLHLAPILDDRNRVDFLAFSLVNVSGRKTAEEQIFRLNRLYSVRSRVNETIIRTHDQALLYRQICRIAVEEGLFKMAWVGITDQQTAEVRPVAQWGDAGGYLDTISVVADDGPHGRGPTGRAIYELRSIVCNDIAHDPLMQDWRDKALAHGFRSAAAFPLRASSVVIGALTVYADAPEYFSDDEIYLLSALAGDISHAIDSITSEKKRIESEGKLITTNDLLKLFSQSLVRREYLDRLVLLLGAWTGCANIGIRILDDNGHIAYAASAGFNPEFMERENCLSLGKDHCICPRIIAEMPESSELPYLTAGGSFFCNHAGDLFTHDVPPGTAAYRHGCLQHGFASLAVIPIRYRERVLGAIQLADRQEEMVPLERILFIESIAPLIGEALYRFSIEEALTQSREQLRALSEHLQTTREEERIRISREIHDELGQILTAASIELAGTEEDGIERALLRGKIASASELIDIAIEDVQRICSELRPRVLDHLGLVAALEWQADEFTRRTGIRCSLEMVQEKVSLPADISTALFRVFQEALTNTARHSGAQTVSVCLRVGDAVTLEIRDDGKGITHENISDSRSFGIIGIRERIYALGGTVSISGMPGSGTTIVARVPLKCSEGDDVQNSDRR